MKTMRTLLLLACAAGVSVAQPATPPKEKAKKSELETMLEEAFKNNPDLRVAEAKLLAAQAEWSRARLLLANQVVAADLELRVAKVTYAEATRRFERMKELLKRAAISQEEYAGVQQGVVKAKGELEAAEAKLNYLTGRTGERDKASVLGEYYRRTGHLGAAEFYDKVASPWAGAAFEVPTGEVVDQLRNELKENRTVDVNFDEFDPAATPQEIFGAISRRFKLPISVAPAEKMPKFPLTEMNNRTTMYGMFQRFEDFVPTHVFIVRDYGLVYVPRDKVPPGAMTLKEFRKLMPAPVPKK